MPPAMAEDVRAFGRKLTPLVGPSNVSYTPGVVLHIWHGNRADRDYTHRYQILLLNKYDPVRDVRVSEDGGDARAIQPQIAPRLTPCA